MQAIIITAYRDLEQVNLLADLLSRKFEIYIHIDKRVPWAEVEKSGLLKFRGGVNAYQKFRVNWGSPNHLWSILYCIQEALKNPLITYFHIISGEDFPVRNVEEIYNFFEDEEKIYCDFSSIKCMDEKRRRRYQRWHRTYSFLNIFDYKNVPQKILVKLIVAFQICIGVNRLKKIDVELAQGLVWGGYPRKAIEYCMKYAYENPEFLTFLEYGHCSEEFFFSTILSNADYWKDKIVNNCYRYMSWEKRNGSYPAILDESDIDKIWQGDYMFARKIRRPISNLLLKKINTIISNEVI